MGRYVIYKPANATLDEIWQYSVENWGEQQAEVYIEGLFDTLHKAADREFFWRKLQEQTVLDVYFVKYQRHYLFFRHNRCPCHHNLPFQDQQLLNKDSN